MNKKSATEVKSVSFPENEKYAFFGFTFELPTHVHLDFVQVEERRVIAHTSAGKIILRHCLKCKRLRPLEDFYRQCGSCKTCHIFMVKKWKKNNPERVKLQAQKCAKKYRLAKKIRDAGLA